jgi:hypothetical protein
LRERTLEGSKASKRACRPPYPVEPGAIRDETPQTSAVTRKRAAPSDSREPSSRPPSPASPHGPAEARGRHERGKGSRTPRTAPHRWVGRARTRKEATARENGYGSSGGEGSVGRLQGREWHEIKPRSVGAPRRAAGSARGSCVPRARPEPSRGARTLRTAPVGAWRPSPSPRWARARCGATRGTRRQCARGSKNLKRDDPGLGTDRAGCASDQHENRRPGSRDAVRL